MKGSDLMNKSALRDCEAIAFNAITISCGLGAVVSLTYFLMTVINPVAVASQIVDIIICLSLFYLYRQSSNKYKYHIILLLFYFVYNFCAIWFILSFHHPMVILYLLLILLGNILLLKRKHLKIIIASESVILIGMLIYDYSYRNLLIYNESMTFGRLLGSIIVILTICYIIYKFKSVIDLKVNTLEQYSFIDPLTEAKNSRAFADDYLSIMNTWNRERVPFAVVNIDINDFKTINDTYGHQVGDDVLKELVIQIKRVLRKGESIYRIGGDEFIVLLNGSNRSVAHKFFKRITRQHHLELDFSISYGVADSYETINNGELLSLADKRMYANKKANKNLLDLDNPYGGQLSFAISS